MTDPTNGDLADEIERLDGEATPGPWVGPYSDLREDDDTTWTAFSDEDAALVVHLRNRAALIATRLREADALRADHAAWNELLLKLVMMNFPLLPWPELPQDQAFVAHVIDSLRAEVEEWREIMGALIDWFGVPNFPAPPFSVELARRIDRAFAAQRTAADEPTGDAG